MESVQTFYKELAPILEKHRDSLDKLVDRTQASKVTVWRWLNKINTNYPDPNKLLSILSKICGYDKVKDIGAYFGGEIEKYLNESFSTSFEDFYENSLLPEDKQQKLFKDFYAFLIYTMCGNLGGVSEKELVFTVGNIAVRKSDIPLHLITDEMIEAHGMMAIPRIHDFVKLGILELREDGKYHRLEKDVDFGSNLIAKYMGEIMSSCFRFEECHMGYNSFFTYMETIPVKIAFEIARDIKSFHKQTMEKMNKYRSVDGIPYQFIGFGERLKFDKFKNSASEMEVQ